MSRDTQHLKRTSLLVEAPAGSGKTFRLVERFVHLLQQGARPWEIQAVTFTDKAAREMRERVMRVLLASYPETFRTYEWYLPRLRISTFHSAYRTLLRRLALLRRGDLPGDPGFDVLDEVEAERYRQQALQEVLRSYYPDDPAVKEALNTLLDRPDTRIGDALSWPLKFVRGRPHLDFMRMEAYLQKLNAWLPRAPVERALQFRDVFVQRGETEVLLALEEVLRSGLPVDDTVLTVLRDWNRRTTTRGYKRDVYREVISPLKQFVNQLMQFQMLYQRMAKMLPFLDAYRQTYRELKRRDRVVDYDDLEVLSLQVVLGATENLRDLAFRVLLSFNERTTHLMVDEFQDSNLLQWQFVWALVEDWFSGQSAHTERGGGTLFLVGDPRQSIYRFRGTNVHIFPYVRKFLENVRPDERAFRAYTLRENRRSLPAIVHTVNAVFSRVFDAYAPFEPTRTAENDPGRVELVILVPQTDEAGRLPGKPDRLALEGRWVLNRIRQMLEDEQERVQDPIDRSTWRRPRLSDMAILVRDRTLLQGFLQVLKEAEIPFQVRGDRGLWARREAQEILALLDALLLEGYVGTAWMGTLSERAPRVEEVLRIARARLRAFPLSRVLRETLHHLELDRDPDDRVRYNRERVLSMIEKLETRGYAPFRVYQAMKQAALRGEDDEAELPASSGDRLQILTVHAAKGLEFPVVFIVGLSENSRYRSDLVRLEDLESGDVFVHLVEKGDPREDIYVEEHWEEEKRIQYVAWTRARDRLFLVATGGDWLEKKLKREGGYRGLRQVFPLLLLQEGLRLQRTEDGKWHSPLEEEVRGFVVRTLTADQVPPLRSIAPASTVQPSGVREAPPFPAGLGWIRVSETIPELPWTVPHRPSDRTFGELFHRLLEALSRGEVSPEEEAVRVFLQERMRPLRFPAHFRSELIEKALRHLARLRGADVWARWLTPRPHAFSEWAFVQRLEDRVVEGRVDRVVLEPETGRAEVVDYKTFDVPEEGLEELVARYRPQLTAYAHAVYGYFDVKRVDMFLLLTPTARVVPAGSFPAD